MISENENENLTETREMRAPDAQRNVGDWRRRRRWVYDDERTRHRESVDEMLEQFVLTLCRSFDVDCLLLLLPLRHRHRRRHRASNRTTNERNDIKESSCRLDFVASNVQTMHQPKINNKTLLRSLCQEDG